MKNWIKSNYLFVLIILLFLIKAYFLTITANQALWWDEADYMNMARAYLGADYWDLNYDIVRPILLPILITPFLFLGLGEVTIRFFMILCSITSVILLYKIGALLFNKRIAFYSAFMLSVFWSFNFHSFRILADVPLTMFWLATIYFFLFAYYKNKNKYFILSGIFLGLSFMMKSVSAMLVLFLGIYILTTEKLNVFKNKKIYIFFLISLLTVIPFFAYQFFVYGHPLAFQKAATLTSSVDRFEASIDIILYIIEIIYPILAVCFGIGLLYMLNYLYTRYGSISKKESYSNKLYFIFLWLVVSFGFFVWLGLMTKMYIDERYFFIFFPAIFLICAIGLDRAYKKIMEYLPEDIVFYKHLMIIIISVLLITSSYQHLSRANYVIKAKSIGGYDNLKQASLFVKSISNEGDVILIIEEFAEVSYYSERNFIHIGMNSSDEIDNIIKEYKPSFVVMSFLFSLGGGYEKSLEYITTNQELFTPIWESTDFINENLPIAIVFKIKRTATQ